MPKTNLTDLAIKRLKPPEKGQATTWDTSLPGFGVRCSQGGTKTFIVMHGKHRKRVSIGRYPIVSLSAARQKAKEVLLNATLQTDTPPSPTFDVAIERYLRHREPELRPRTWQGYRQLLTSHFHFCDTSIDDISTHMVADALDQIERPTQRFHAYKTLKVFFNWCIEREYCDANPLARIKKPKAPSAKERVLDDDELAAIWHATQDMGKYGTIVRLLMVTGQRKAQIANLQTNWIDTKTKVFSFPGDIMKNGRSHRLPYGDLTAFLLTQSIPHKGYYFSPLGLPGRPFSAWSKNKKKLDAMLPDMDPWTLHDLRRTWSTNAARLNVPPHITDRVLSHASGTLLPVARIYNRYRYEQEVREAVVGVEAHITEMVQS